jgi:AcrR family transcriptional regulator
VAETTRDKIIKAALDLVAKQGLEQTSFQQIANKIGMSQAAIIHHFPSKRKLFEALLFFIIKRNSEFTGAKVTSRDSARVKLKRHFEGHVEWVAKHPEDAHIMLVFYSLAGQEKTYGFLYDSILKVAREKIADIIHAGQRERAWPLKTENEVLVVSLIHDALLAGIVNWFCTGASKKELLHLRKRWNLLLKCLLGIDACL